jgi:hypothetical protein
VTSSLSGRVKSLERQGRGAAGCSTCGGRGFHIVEPDESEPTWLDGFSCCRQCGEGVKVYYRDLWDRP